MEQPHCLKLWLRVKSLGDDAGQLTNAITPAGPRPKSVGCLQGRVSLRSKPGSASAPAKSLEYAAPQVDELTVTTPLQRPIAALGWLNRSSRPVTRNCAGSIPTASWRSQGPLTCTSTCCAHTVGRVRLHHWMSSMSTLFAPASNTNEVVSSADENRSFAHGGHIAPRHRPAVRRRRSGRTRADTAPVQSPLRGSRDRSPPTRWLSRHPWSEAPGRAEARSGRSTSTEEARRVRRS